MKEEAVIFISIAEDLPHNFVRVLGSSHTIAGIRAN